MESRAQFKLIKLQAERDADMEMSQSDTEKNLLFPLYWVAVARARVQHLFASSRPES